MTRLLLMLAWFLLLISARIVAQPPVEEGAESAWGYEVGVPVAMSGTAAPVHTEVIPRRAMGTSDVRVTSTVERHPDNRLLVIVLDGPQYMRQDIELNTDERYEDARLCVRWFKSVPTGRYVVIAQLFRVGGKSFRATSEFCLLGMNESCE